MAEQPLTALWISLVLYEVSPHRAATVRERLVVLQNNRLLTRAAL